VRKFKIFFLTAFVIGLFSVVGCSKSNSNSTPASTSDSVYSSGWLSFQMTPEVSGGDTVYQTTFTNAAITSAVVDNGIVLSYLGFAESSGTGTGNDTVSEQTLEYNTLTSYQIGSVTIESFPPDAGGFGDLSTNVTGLVFRYVIVPGRLLAATKLTPQQLKAMNYTEVTKLLGTISKQAAAPTLTN
jgi:hypothetical protein